MMTRGKLLLILRAAKADTDTEGAHERADKALVAYINDDEITTAWESVPKWYA